MVGWSRKLVMTLALVAAALACRTRASAALAPVPIRDVRIDDGFWSPKREVWEKVTIPDCLNKFEKDGAFENFDKVRDGRGGEHGGPPWYDGLVYETITGSADFLIERPDPQLRRRIEGYVGRIAAAAAKSPDGYLNTWTQLKEPAHRWGRSGGNDLWQHDLYNAGCLIEAGVHWYRATGDTALLAAAARLANLMCDEMGPPPRKNVIPGHAIGEAALVEMWQLFRERPELKKRLPFPVDEARYLELARFWIDSRGDHAGRKDFGAYDQDDRPVLEQEAIEGHAVRATVMATGLTALASAADRDDYRRAARRLWESMVDRRMYVTGGVGAVAGDEKFGADYFLPNNGYLETCAAVGAAFFDRAMNADTGDARCADELERELYNGALCGVSLSGARYFYDNPLEAGKNRLRWAWHSCPCCPPMFLKLTGALPGCVYATGADGLYVNLYAGSLLRTRVGTTSVSLRQTTNYPWEGDVRLTIEGDEPAEFGLNLRVPGWCQGQARPDDLYAPQGRPRAGAFEVKVNGEAVSPPITDGYARLRHRWQRGDVVDVRMAMPARRVLASPKVAAAAGRGALSRGPLIYCLESVDNDGRVRNLSLPDDSPLRAEFRPDLLGGVAVVHAPALASFAGEAEPRPVELTAVPYYANANRGPVSMCVWIPRSAADALAASVAETAAAAAPQTQPAAGEATIRVDAGKPGKPVSRYLTGACIEDVNHEIYGGIYSQMIFGESFQEPPHAEPVKGFWSPDGDWQVKDGEVSGGGGQGPKLVSSFHNFDAGEAGVEVFMSGDGAPADGAIHNAGLIVAAGRAAAGADSFFGYEVSIDPGRRTLAIGRHQRNYRLLKEVPCDVPTNRWVALSVRLDHGAIEASLDGRSVLRVEDCRPLPAGTVGLRQWQRPARYRNLWVKPADGPREGLPFEPPPAPVAVSGAWGPAISGSAVLRASIERERPFTGSQSQRVTFDRGEGEAGIANEGLNRWGMNFVGRKPYEGYVWLRAEKPLEVLVTLENRDGTATCARAPLAVDGGDEWRRYDFTLTPDAANPAGRLALRLKSPGSVVVGHAFLQPGEWGRFKGLPVRRDVAEGLIDQGVTVLRYGGSMVNAPEYRWKKMIGPRDRRPPYKGTWYPRSSNGWGIIDFLDLCEAAGFLAIPDFNLDESPQDMADFVEYANGPADSEWGRRRAAGGHPAPYHLRHVELGNEEKVDETYFRKFEALARAMWAKDPQIILVVGDFQYEKPITDPMHVEGADSGITSLAAHRKILDLARQNDREVWFDVHVWTETAGTPSARAFPGYVDAIDRLAEGARHHVVVFEFNANTHDQRRALANAGGIGAMIRDGRVPVALSANCLQPDGQNDNGWDQGLLFLNPTNVWLQPPGYVTRMFSHGYEPQAIEARVEGQGGAAADDGKLSVSAARSEDGKRLVLYVVNQGDNARPANVRLEGFTPSNATAKVEELAGPPWAVNTTTAPDPLTPRQFEWRYEPKDGAAAYTFPANSFTVIRFD